MKGSLHTDELMSAVVSREGGSARAAHQPCIRFGCSVYHKTLFVTDAAVNIQPDLETKIDILQNAIDMMLTLEVANPKVAILSAVESVNPAIPPHSMLPLFAKWSIADRLPGQSSMARSHSTMPFPARRTDQEIKSPVAGDPDLLMVPNLEAGNISSRNFNTWPEPWLRELSWEPRFRSFLQVEPTENWLEWQAALSASCSRSRRPTSVSVAFVSAAAAEA